MASGRYNRRESPTQTPATALQQVASGEVWGRTPRNGLGPAVQAYRGDLQSRRGINFTTIIDPHRTEASPFEVRWYLNIDDGVEHRSKDGEDFACVKAVVTNLQP
jgi:hypothetical protein